MKQYNILIVDDEYRIRRLISEFLLREEGYKIIEAADGEEALNIIFPTKGKTKIDLVVLDVMMPKYDGWTVLERIREFSKIPVVMLTAKSDEQDQLRGFRLGADDYVTKPFSPGVLVARINKILKKEIKETEEITYGIIRMNFLAREVYIDNVRVDFTPKEFELLKYFIDNKGLALSRDKILNNVWNYDYYGDLRTVDTHVKQLRAKLGKAGNYITTVRSVGYKLELEYANIN